MKRDKQKTQRLFSVLLNLNRMRDVLVYTLDIPKTSPQIRVVCSWLILKEKYMDFSPILISYGDCINLLTPNVNYSGRTALLTSKVAFYIFIQQI